MSILGDAKLTNEEYEELFKALAEAREKLSKARGKARQVLRNCSIKWIRSCQKAIIVRSTDTLMELRDIVQDLIEERP